MSGKRSRCDGASPRSSVVHEPLVEHALVRGVLVDEQHAVVELAQEVGAAELGERRDDESRAGVVLVLVLVFVLGVRASKAPSGAFDATAARAALRHPRASALPLRRDAATSAGRSPRRADGSAERAAHGVLHGALDRPALAEAHLGLRGVHVHVDDVGGDDELEEHRRARARRGSSERYAASAARMIPPSRIARPFTER